MSIFVQVGIIYVSEGMWRVVRGLLLLTAVGLLTVIFTPLGFPYSSSGTALQRLFLVVSVYFSGWHDHSCRNVTTVGSVTLSILCFEPRRYLERVNYKCTRWDVCYKLLWFLRTVSLKSQLKRQAFPLYFTFVVDVWYECQ